ncbi:MAG TPA: hypothetical protein VFS60_19855 [Thermoanaerobaculia bacterium]|nr:hypothetical protein [Thermoanaerobaculia bacterium]
MSLAPARQLKAALSSVLLLCAAYAAVLMVFGRFAQTDEAFFKTAGREWALHGRFAAPELRGLFSLQPPVERVFFAHPPLYPFGFGLFMTTFGFGWRTCVAYDVAIHIALVLLTFAIAYRLSATATAAALAACMVLPLGTASRPDELAMCFAMAAAWMLLGRPATSRRAAIAGLLLGLAAGASTGAAIVIGFSVAVLLIANGEPIRRRIAMLALCGTAAGLTLAAVVAPILIAHPDAYHQYLGHAANYVGSHQWIADFRSAWRYGKGFIVFDGVCIAVGLAAFLTAERRFRKCVEWWLGAAFGLAFVLVLLPSKYTYLWFVGPWLAAACVASLAAARPIWLRTAGSITLAIGWTFGAMGYAWQTVTMLTLPGEQRIAVCEKRVRDLVPEGAVVLAGEYWWTLGADHVVLDPTFADYDLSTVDYIVLTGNGTGKPGKAQALKAPLADVAAREFVVVGDHLNREPLTLFGRQLTRSAWGFGAVVMKNRRLPDATFESASEPGSQGRSRG